MTHPHYNYTDYTPPYYKDTRFGASDSEDAQLARALQMSLQDAILPNNTNYVVPSRIADSMTSMSAYEAQCLQMVLAASMQNSTSSLTTTALSSIKTTECTFVEPTPIPQVSCTPSQIQKTSNIERHASRRADTHNDIADYTSNYYWDAELDDPQHALRTVNAKLPNVHVDTTRGAHTTRHVKFADMDISMHDDISASRVEKSPHHVVRTAISASEFDIVRSSDDDYSDDDDDEVDDDYYRDHGKVYGGDYAMRDSYSDYTSLYSPHPSPNQPSLQNKCMQLDDKLMPSTRTVYHVPMHDTPSLSRYGTLQTPISTLQSTVPTIDRDEANIEGNSRFAHMGARYRAIQANWTRYVNRLGRPPRSRAAFERLCMETPIAPSLKAVADTITRYIHQKTCSALATALYNVCTNTIAPTPPTTNDNALHENAYAQKVNVEHVARNQLEECAQTCIQVFNTDTPHIKTYLQSLAAHYANIIVSINASTYTHFSHAARILATDVEDWTAAFEKERMRLLRPNASNYNDTRGYAHAWKMYDAQDDAIDVKCRHVQCMDAHLTAWIVRVHVQVVSYLIDLAKSLLEWHANDVLRKLSRESHTSDETKTLELALPPDDTGFLDSIREWYAQVWTLCEREHFEQLDSTILKFADMMTE